MCRKLSFLFLVLVCARTSEARYPAPVEGDYVIRNFRFASGETLPELRLHYRTLGKLERDAQGVVRNAVLILHGLPAASGQLPAGRSFGGELFGAGAAARRGRATSSCSPTTSATVDRASRATGCAADFPTTATAT